MEHKPEHESAYSEHEDEAAHGSDRKKHGGQPGNEPQPARQGNLGPAIHPGGEVDTGDALVPPYEGRSTEGKDRKYIDQEVEQESTDSKSTDDDDAESPTYEGTGPAHIPGVARGEDRAKD